MDAEPGTGDSHTPQTGRNPSLEAALVESALLHATRASILRIEIEQGRSQRSPVGRLFGGRLAAVRTSHRVRFAALIARRTVRSLREDGIGETFGRMRSRLLPAPARGDTAQGRGTPIEAATDDPYLAPVSFPAPLRLQHRVLIVAELSLAQCAKYRVWQKQEQFRRLGIPCSVVEWQRTADALSMLQTHTLAIFYRVPGFPAPLEVIEEAARVGVETIWEVDDLIFDLDLYGANANITDLPAAEKRELISGVSLFRKAMLACGRTIGSTSVLSALMEAATGRPGHVVPNALDRDTLAFADEAVRARDRGDDGRVVIAYGSGTSTHDADFGQASPALLRLLGAHPNLVLRVGGPLNLPDAFDDFPEQVERVPLTNFKAYLGRLANADISLAPLEDTVFNDAKSNIKLIEAAMVGLPSVCSPRREFRDAIEHGVDGFLADSEAEWVEALETLIGDPALRRALGERSRARMLARYAPGAIAQRHVRPIGALMPATRRARLRVLIVNIYFSPQSLGGATIIAEEMAERLAARGDTECFVFASHGVPAPQYTLRRYEARGSDVIGVSLPRASDDILAFDDPEMARLFTDVLEAVAPDVVHFHSIQHFGAGIVRACQLALVPYVITVHDAWWLCQLQFMVRRDNTYCHQTTIDLKVCRACLPHAHHLQSRMDILSQALHGAARVLSPSASHGALYRANGVPASRLVVHRNGVRMPARARPKRAPGPLRFGYVGGDVALKGVGVVRGAFERLTRTDWVLVLVDNTLNLGFSSFAAADWTLDGRVEIVPAYRQDEIDGFFESIDVLLFPSQWKESFGMTVREALARDVWVVATDSGGAAEEIVPGVNGQIIPMGNDPAGLADAVAGLLAEPGWLEGYINPFKAGLATLDRQAEALHAILSEVSGTGDAAMAAEQQQQQNHHQQEHA